MQNVGWKGKVRQGARAGSIGEARNLEALRVEINYGSLCMKAHRATYGWDSGYRCANPIHSIQIGTVGMNTAIEAISYYHCPDSRLGGQGDIWAEGWLRNDGQAAPAPPPGAVKFSWSL
ncbi:hypothetical protein SNE510_34430 [Streptomyces sp. NE5-10]|uniref:hypothetical protein n=1 Tax=Streptomyces sp. NE5-10 TaxID=2759674 RepID=UPI0019057261|nr:hypothetical protein [Streptomyces sp. NE5-10]GHJ93924.1 hypothetical protein SNE510_34430 [Streptomyces sp. NE5-10]